MIMTGIAMLGVLVDRPATVMRLVMLSAAIVMLISPEAILGPSFQMSFAAVLCLIAAYERAPGWTAGEPRVSLPAWIRAGVETSLCNHPHIADCNGRNHAVFDLSFRHFQYLRFCRQCAGHSADQLLGDAVHSAGLYHRAVRLGWAVHHRRGMGRWHHYQSRDDGIAMALCIAACIGNACGIIDRSYSWWLVALFMAAALAVFGIAAGFGGNALSALYRAA